MEADAEIVEIYCAKKAGKTYSLIYKGIEEVLRPRGKDDNYVSVISLTHPHCRLSFDKICLKLEQSRYPIMEDHRRQNPGKIRLKNMAREWVTLQCFQVGDPEANLGPLWDFSLMDEFPRFPASVWDDYLSPNVSRAYIAGSPHGRKHPAYQFYLNGQKEEYRKSGEFYSVNFDVFSNTKREGYSPDGNHTGEYERVCRRAEWAKKNAYLTYLSDYLGETPEGGDTFFKNVDLNFDKELKLREDGVIIPAQYNKFYSIGIDLARYRDFTVISVLDEDFRLCYWKKVGHYDWNTQKLIISNAIRAYHGKTYADATGQGQPVVEDLIHTFGEDVEAFTFTVRSRDELLSNLMIDINDARLRLAEIPDLRDALDSVFVEKKDSGKTQIGDDERGHLPDEVSSLALAAWGLKDFPHRFKFAVGNYGKVKEAPAYDDCGRPVYKEEEKSPYADIYPQNRIKRIIR